MSKRSLAEVLPSQKIKRKNGLPPEGKVVLVPVNGDDAGDNASGGVSGAIGGVSGAVSGGAGAL